MSKNKTSANGVAVLEPTASETQPLLRINFDEIDSLKDRACRERDGECDRGQRTGGRHRRAGPQDRRVL